MKSEKILFSDETIRRLSVDLGELHKGYRISELFKEIGMIDTSNESTKWRRINHTFLEKQRKDGTNEAILLFIEKSLVPVLFVPDISEFEFYREKINNILSFDGYMVTKEGKVVNKNTSARTIEEAIELTCNPYAKLSNMDLHPFVFHFCSDELKHNNMFHALFEATKGLAQRVRDLTGIEGLDGSKLFNTALSQSDTKLYYTPMRTQTDLSVQNGFKELLNGVFHLIRNHNGHELKIKCEKNDVEALELFVMISYLHRQLNKCKLPHEIE